MKNELLWRHGYPLHPSGKPGEMGGCCTTVGCQFSRVRPVAKWYDTVQKTWVCFSCAQKVNRFALAHRCKKICITEQEYLVNLLRDS